MRPITKILLLLVAAFVVFLLWPHTADLKAFDPAKLSNLEVTLWQAEKAGKGFDALMTRYKIYTSQYHFAPIPAFRTAQSEGAAIKQIELSRQQESDPTNESRALTLLTEKYTWIKKQAKLTLDADAMAREEFAWRTMAMDNEQPQEVAAPYARILAALYGGPAEDFNDAAAGLMSARSLIFEGSSDVADPVAEAKSAANDADSLLREIAQTPVEPPAQ